MGDLCLVLRLVCVSGDPATSYLLVDLKVFGFYFIASFRALIALNIFSVLLLRAGRLLGPGRLGPGRLGPGRLSSRCWRALYWGL